ncbi:flavodoxin domain-containing protein [Bacillus sp. B15-48]|uniref:flavodoxin domain-containing protein n=1 Tax=Bacillus sp. B15-48 TaxID=1548601 RepID=UPI00193F5287|nr:flavodoxin domain-containing protein [Bacillus sp. B15-48]MBM4764500.1 flavodoxin [Bacillus sp. B15-48]
MNTLIVYCTSHGTTTKAAISLKKQLDGEVIVLNLNQAKLHSDIELFDSVIIGGSIRVGRIQGKIKKFIKQHEENLYDKKIGLFLCCMRDGEVAEEQFEGAFPMSLRERAIAKGLFGGEFLFSKMNFFERQIVTKISGMSADISLIDEYAIKEFANCFNNKEVSGLEREIPVLT